MKISDWRKSLDIIAKYSKKGEDGAFIFDAEHDIIYSHLMLDEVPEDSEDGKALEELGWHVSSDADCWATFT